MVCVNYEYVERAEANLEFSKDGATFIDRDPTHFPIILAHMRNKCEGLGLSLTMGATRHTTTVSLPKDHATLGELLLEAKHYQLPELEKRICKRYFVTSHVQNGLVGRPRSFAVEFVHRFLAAIPVRGG